MNLLGYLLGEVARAMDAGDDVAAEHFRARYFHECARLGEFLREVMPNATFH